MTVRHTLAAICCLCLVVAVHAAKVKVKAEPDPRFDFATVHTWAWDADAGEVIMARTPSDDPAVLKQRIDPLIRTYVEAEMVKRHLTVATGGAPDVQLHYYVLVTVGASGQFMGQFLPAVPYWGLPAFSYGATTSLSIVTKGSLVLDAMQPGEVGKRHVVWRGIAESTVEDADSDAVRDARIRDAAAGLVKRFPRQKKK
jgi:hypothetical protein